MRTIQQLRAGRGWSRLQLANEVGVTPGTIYNWERGIYEPRASQLREVARVFGVSMDDIELVKPEGKVLAAAS